MKGYLIMITKEFTDFFKNLKNNNSKAWFDENRKIYETKIREPFKEFINILIFKIITYSLRSQINANSKIDFIRFFRI